MGRQVWITICKTDKVAIRLADGTAASVISLTETGTNEPVYNMDVDGWHTYHVGILGTCVHNMNCNLADLPLHTNPDRAYVRAGELLTEANITRRHPINDLQTFGGPELGRGGVRDLTNDELLRFGGVSDDDPLRVARAYAPTDNLAYAGSRIAIHGGHHRFAEIARRVNLGLLSPDTLIEVARAG